MEQVTETRSTRGYFRSSPSTAFDQYLQDIQKLPLIDDPEEERRLARRAQRGDEKAAERLVTANLRFVISYVKKYQGHGLDLSELVAIGNEGLLKAFRKRRWRGDRRGHGLQADARVHRSCLQEVPVPARAEDSVPLLRPRRRLRGDDAREDRGADGCDP